MDFTSKKGLLTFTLVFVIFSLSAQRETNKWKAQLALGVNSPSQSGFVDSFQGKTLNFPTINLGIQNMFDDHE